MSAVVVADRAFPAAVAEIVRSSAEAIRMSDIRIQFRDFLLRLADNNLRDDDWSRFATQHYPDDELEQLRQTLVKRSLEFPEWQVGWIPREFQTTARRLAEYLREFPEDSISYWTEWSEISNDGTIHIKVTWCDSESHSTGMCDIPREHREYDFWKWLISHDDVRPGRKSKAEIDALKTKYAKKH